MLAIRGGKILTITKGTIEEGTVLIDDGKIVDVGADVEVPKGAEVIDASGKVVMPGLVEAHCHIGIWEETVGWAGSDGNEVTDPATPHMRALDAIKANADEGGLEAALKAGVTTVQILPGSANVVGGTGLVLKTAPKVVVDEMVIRNPSGMKIAFGENPRRIYGQEQKKMPSTRMGVAGILRDWLQKARNYMEKKEQFKDDPEKMPEVDGSWRPWSPCSGARYPCEPTPTGRTTSRRPSASPRSSESRSPGSTRRRGTGSPSGLRRRVSLRSGAPASRPGVNGR